MNSLLRHAVIGAVPVVDKLLKIKTQEVTIMQKLTVINGGQARLNNSEEILESRSIRDRYADQVDVLNKVKKLSMLPDDIHVTVEMAANYYEVEVNTLKQIIKRHRGELESDGFKVLIGSQLDEFVRYTMYPANYGISLKTRSLTLLPRRAVLRIGMLLRDSEVAKTVRSYLLNVEEKASDKQRQQAMEDEINKFKEAFFTPDNLRNIAATMEENVTLKTENHLLLQEVNVLTPKAESHDHYMAEGKATSVGQVAKVLNFRGVGRNTLFSILRKWEHFSSSPTEWNLPYQRYVDAGYYEIIWRLICIGDDKQQRALTLITPRGVEYIRQRLIKDGYEINKMVG